MRIDRLTSKLQLALSDAQSLAVGMDHSAIEPLHLLQALLEQQGGSIKPLLMQVGFDINSLRKALSKELDHLPKIQSPTGDVNLSQDLARLLTIGRRGDRRRGGERLGVEGLVRIGSACYTTDDEVRRVTDFLRSQGAPVYEAQIRVDDGDEEENADPGGQRRAPAGEVRGVPRDARQHLGRPAGVVGVARLERVVIHRERLGLGPRERPGASGHLTGWAHGEGPGSDGAGRRDGRVPGPGSGADR